MENSKEFEAVIKVSKRTTLNVEEVALQTTKSETILNGGTGCI